MTIWLIDCKFDRLGTLCISFVIIFDFIYPVYVTHSLIHSHTHPFTHSLTHSTIHFSTSFPDTVFTTFGGDIHIRGKQGQPTLNSLVNIVLQAVGENALPNAAQRVPLELGSVMHDGSFKYDLTTLLRTGEANFTGNAIVDGNQLLGPVQGLFQVLYFLGEIAVQFDQAAPAYLQGLPIVHYNATDSPTSAPTVPKPTTFPSITPTLAPSASPSTFPTTAPTVVPSLAPSFAPSVKPTFAPTFAPTLSEATQLTIKLQNYLASNLTQNSSVSSHSSLSVLYQEVVARGGMPAVGGCSNWKVSTGSGLSTTLLTQVATSVSMFVYNDNRSVIITSYYYENFPSLVIAQTSHLLLSLFLYLFLQQCGQDSAVQ